MKFLKSAVLFFFLFSTVQSTELAGLSVSSSVQTFLASQSDTTQTLPSKPADSTATGPHLIKKTYDHKQQVFLGIAMMAFIAIIFGTTQSWNP